MTLHERDGHDVNLARLREFEINRLGIGRKFQTPSIYKSHTVYDNLVLSLNKDRGCSKPVLPQSSEDRERIMEVLKTVRLEGARRSRRIAVTRAEAVAGDRHAAGTGSAHSAD